METSVEQQVITKTVLLIEDVRFDAAEVIGVLECLARTDGVMVFCLIQTSGELKVDGMTNYIDLREILEAGDVIRTSNRGSSYKSTNYLVFCEQVGRTLGYGDQWTQYIDCGLQ